MDLYVRCVLVLLAMAAVINSAMGAAPGGGSGRNAGGGGSDGGAQADGKRSVRVVRQGAGWALLRNGERFEIRGVGGSQRLAELKEAGGNAIRTWSVDQAEPVLDEAHRLGIAVTVGLWVAHPRHGFDYNDTAKVEAARAKHLADVRRLKGHPAILMWAIGNEVELGFDGDRTQMWREVNRIAEGVKQEDPTRPTMLVVAEVDARKINEIKSLCPAIDVLGINSYGRMDSAAMRARGLGWDGPVAMTEFGPRGWWEVEQTPWKTADGAKSEGVPIEPSSTDKADTYLARSLVGLKGNPAILGSYAFLWGQKQECTHTWFGMFLPEGDKLGAVDAMSYVWTGRWPANRAPRLWDLVIQGKTDGLAPGEAMRAGVSAVDPDGDPLSITWEVREESSDRRSGGDAEAVPPTVPTTFDAKMDGPSRGVAGFVAPSKPGRYRLFVYVRDGKGNAATGNVPFRVSGPGGK